MTRVKSFLLAIVLIVAHLAAPGTVQAQAILLSDEQSNSESQGPVLPDPLTEEAIRRVLSELDDSEVRALLLRRLSIEAQKTADALLAQETSAPDDTLTDSANAFIHFLVDVVTKAPLIPKAIVDAAEAFAVQRGETSGWHFLRVLFLSFAIGLFAWWLATRALARLDRWMESQAPDTLFKRIQILSLRLTSQSIRVLVFALCAQSTNAWINNQIQADRSTLAAIISATAWIWMSLVIARFLFAPQKAALRLCPIDDRSARFLTKRVVLITALFTFGFGFTGWLNEFGSTYQESWHGFWINLALHILLATTVWQARHSIRAMLARDEDDTSRAHAFFVTAWPAVVIALIVILWLLIEVLVAVAKIPPDFLTVIAATLVILMALPFADRAMHAVVLAWLPEGSEPAAATKAVNNATRKGIERISRVIGSVMIILFLLSLWDIDVVGLAEQRIGTRFSGALVNSLLIIAFGYGAWELVRIVIGRQIAMERVALGRDPDAEAAPEGGGEGARLGTMLPLVGKAAQVVIVVISVLALLGEFGVNVLPLLAGAGVVGIAVGFGAQTLVKDIVSGIFFLIDDAFRMGEYVDIGTVKGTVEKISIRSMQLRHHRGILNTVPFGDIRHVANFSRDWVIMKFPLRVTYDADAEQVRKLVKNLGQELLNHPEHGSQFLQPLKCQGVVQMEDSAMIMPVKFMSRPGEQWLLRRLVLTKIHELFEANGIKFATREVTVRLHDKAQDDSLTDADRTAIAGAASRIIRDEEDGKTKAG